MFLSDWRRWLNQLSRSTQGNPGRHARRPRMEELEERTVPAVHDVTTGMTFGTIQAAVNAANPGDTILADAGTYAESVTVNKPLTLQGAQHGVDARAGRPGAGESILDAATNNGQTLLDITANDVTIDGFVVENATNANQSGFGIVIGAGTSGAQLINNIIQDNIAGVALANTPVVNTNEVDYALPAAGSASNAGNTATSTVTGNNQTENSFANLNGLDLTSGDLKITVTVGTQTVTTILTGNITSNNIPLGAFFVNGATPQSVKFQFENATFTYTGQAPANVTFRPGPRIGPWTFTNNGIAATNPTTPPAPALLQHNLFRNNNQPGPASGAAIYSDQFQAGGPLSNVTIDANTFSNNQSAGVQIGPSDPAEGASNLTISNNTLTGNGNGVFLTNTTSSSVTGNTFTGSAGSQLVLGDNDSGIQVTNNFIQNGSTNGIRVLDGVFAAGPLSNVTVHDNDIEGNASAGLRLDSGSYSGTLDAAHNYWGSPTGPTSPNNPGGTGDAIADPNDQVTFSPFLSSGTDSQPNTPGFQPGPNAPLGIAVDGTAGADQLVITATGADAGSYQLNGGPAVPFSNLTSFAFAGGGGADTFTVTNPAGGLFAPANGIFYDAGGGPGAALDIEGGAETSATYSYSPDTAAGHDGTVDLQGNGATAHYSYGGIRPLRNTGTAADVVFNLPTGDGNNLARLSDNGNAGDNLSQLGSDNGTFETTTFTNPTGSLTVNTGSDGETVTVAPMDPGFTAPLVVNSGGGLDTLQVDFGGGTNAVPPGGATFHGAGNGGITLLAGYAAGGVTDNYTDAHTGSVVVDGRTVIYDGLDTARGIFDQLAAGTRTFNFPATDDGITVGDDALAGNGFSGVRGTSNPTTDFPNPTTSLTVNAGLGSDTVTAGPLDTAGAATPVLFLNGFDGSDVAADGGDTFDVTPGAASTFEVDGDNPTPPTTPGDTLNVHVAASPFLTAAPTPTGLSGVYTFANARPVTFQEIETLAPAASSTDLAVSKTDTAGGTFDPATNNTTGGTAAPGTAVTYTIVVRNNGPLGVSGAAVDDTFSATDITSATWTCQVINNPDGNTACGTARGTSDIHEVDDLGVGGILLYTVTANVASGTLGTPAPDLINTATVTPPPPVTDTAPANNTSSDVIALAPVTDVGVRKSGPTSATAGLNATYTITLSNNGPSDAQDVSVTDTLPAGTTLVSETQQSGPMIFACAGGTCSAAPGMAFPAGATATFELVAAVPASAGNNSTLSNVVRVTTSTPDGNAANDSFTTLTPVSTSADLGVTKAGPAGVTAGTDATYTITVSNAGPSDAQGVQLTDTLPPETSPVPPTVTQLMGPTFNCTAPQSGTGGTVTCSINTLANGDSAVFQVVVHAGSGAAGPTNMSSITDTAAVTSIGGTPDSNSGNNSRSVTTPVEASAAVSIGKTGPATITAGANATYTITVTNTGPSDAQTVSISDMLPANTTFVSEAQNPGPSATTTPFQCSTPGAGNAGTVTCSAPALPAGNTASFTLVVRAAPATPNASAIDNVATVTTSTNNTGTPTSSAAHATVSTVADLGVSKTGPSTLTAGTNATYTISVTNLGPSDAQTVNLTDALPANTTFVSQTPAPGFTCTTPTVGGVVTYTCTAPTLAAGASATFVLTVKLASSAPPGGAPLNNVANVMSATSDMSTGNNSSTSSATVAAVADLSVTKLVAPATANEGDPVTYTMTVSNAGPSDAAGVTLNDTLPAGAVFSSATSSQGTFSTFGNTLTYTLGPVPAGATATAQLVVTFPEEASPANTVTVQSTTTDSDRSNNTATASSTVQEPPLLASGTSITITEGTTLTNAVLATFTHGGGQEPTTGFAVAVDWGDHTPAQGVPVVKMNGGYAVLGTHTYTDEANAFLDNRYVITIHIPDDAGHLVIVTTNVQVQETPLPAGVPGGPHGSQNQRYISEVWGDLTAGNPITAAQLNRFNALLEAGAGRRAVVLRMIDAAGGVRRIRARLGIQPGFGPQRAAHIYLRAFLDREPFPNQTANRARLLATAGDAAVISSILATGEYYGKVRY